MNQHDTGGPAFPVQSAADWQAHGMTLRDWFAGKAMQAYLTAPDTGWEFDEVARAAYKMADAMLKARKP